MNVISNDHIDVGAYALGLLEDRDKAVFEAHLATCSSCTAELSTLSPVADLVKGLEPVELPGDAEAAQAPVDLLRRRAGPAGGVSAGRSRSARRPASRRWAAGWPSASRPRRTIPRERSP